MYSKHYDMWVFKIPGQFDRLTDRKKLGALSLPKGTPLRAFVILAYAGIHSLQRVSLWIPAYARMTGESLRNLVPELAEGPPVALLSSSRMRGSILCSLYLWIPAFAGMTEK